MEDIAYLSECEKTDMPLYKEAKSRLEALYKEENDRVKATAKIQVDSYFSIQQVDAFHFVIIFCLLLDSPFYFYNQEHVFSIVFGDSKSQ